MDSSWATGLRKVRSRFPGANHRSSGYRSSVGKTRAQGRLQALRQFCVGPGGTPPTSLCQRPCGPSLPVEGGGAHRVDWATVGGEGELRRGPQGHRAGHPRDSSILCRQGALEREAAFCAQHEKAGVEAGERHRRGAHLSLPTGRLRRKTAAGQSWGESARWPQGAWGTCVTAVALGDSHLPTRPQGALARGVPRPSAALWAYVRGGSLTPYTFFSFVFLGSCCTARAKPALSCSRPAPTPCQSSTFPSAATLSTWKRWLCRGSGSQTTWATGRGARSQKDTCPTSRQGQLSASTRPSPSLPGGKEKGRLLAEAWEPPDPPGGRPKGFPGTPKSQQKTRTAEAPWRWPAGPGPGGSL